MTTYYKATFSDGTVIKRVTASRKYTHAWFVRRRNKPENVEKYGATHEVHGFCGTEQNARNTLPRYAFGDVALAEIAPAIEVTRQEYRK